MSNEKMSADEALKVLRSLVTPKANQSGGRPPIPAPGAEEKRAKAIEFFAALIAERDAYKAAIRLAVATDRIPDSMREIIGRAQS